MFGTSFIEIKFKIQNRVYQNDDRPFKKDPAKITIRIKRIKNNKEIVECSILFLEFNLNRINLGVRNIIGINNTIIVRKIISNKWKCP